MIVFIDFCLWIKKIWWVRLNVKGIVLVIIGGVFLKYWYIKYMCMNKIEIWINSVVCCDFVFLLIEGIKEIYEVNVFEFRIVIYS